MFRRFLAFGLLSMLLLTLIAACSVLQEPEAASGPIEAIPLEVTTEHRPTALPEPTEAEAADPDPEVEPTTVEEAEPQAKDTPAPEPTETPQPTEEPTQPAGPGLLVFQISQDESQVRFVLDEELRGQPKTVVGTTNQVAGEIAVDRDDLSTAQAGIIQVNARTLATDNDFRNRAINNEILETGAHEFITFKPTAINGLPDSVSVGEAVNFTITGDLTIRDITNEATFNVEATLLSDTQLAGSASTIVSRSDYDLRIPSVPNVANVEEEVELYIDFVANAG